MPPKTPKIPLRRRIEENPSAPTMTTPMVVEVSPSEMLENPESSISGTGSQSRSPSPDGITENAPEDTRIRKRVTGQSPSARKKENQISTTNTESDKSNETSSSIGRHRSMRWRKAVTLYFRSSLWKTSTLFYNKRLLKHESLS